MRDDQIKNIISWVNNCIKSSDRGAIFIGNFLTDLRSGSIKIDQCFNFLGLVCQEIEKDIESDKVKDYAPPNSQVEYAEYVINAKYRDFVLKGPLLELKYSYYCKLVHCCPVNFQNKVS